MKTLFCLELSLIYVICIQNCIIIFLWTTYLWWPILSTTTEARSLILWMLSYRPEDRPTIDNILNHPWMKMTSSSSSSSRSSSPARTSPATATTSNYQSPVQKSTSSTTSSHHLHPHHHNHHNHHYYPHHRAPMPSPQLARQVAPKPVKNTPVSPYLTRAALAVASCTPPTTHSRSQASLSSSSPSSSPRSPASLSSASRVSLGTNPSSSGGSCISLLSTGSTASLNGSKSGSQLSIGGEASLSPSSPKIPLMNSRRSRLQAASRRK